MNILARTVGGSLGGQVAASVLASNSGPHGLPAEHGFTVCFVIGAIGLAASFLTSLAIPARAGQPDGGGAVPHRAIRHSPLTRRT
jgi:hypothetical protein